MRISILLITIFVSMLFISGCAVPGFVIKAPDLSNVVQVSPAPGSTTDIHFLQADDYFVFNEALGTNTWNRVWIGKMQTPASTQTQNMAQFVLVQTGLLEWCSYWVKTRPAVSADISLGKVVYFFDQTGANDIYIAPANSQDARSMDWAQSRITDTSEAYKGYIMVGGGYKVSLNNLRVAVQ